MARSPRLWIGLMPDPDREKFVGEARIRIHEFFTAWGRSDANGLAMWFAEMIENIFDHAGGSGTVMIKKLHADGFEFTVEDSGPGADDFNMLVGRTTKPDNGINFGAGLEAIEGATSALKITMTVETVGGFRYKGTIASE